eukprot:gene26042-biopygen13261
MSQGDRNRPGIEAAMKFARDRQISK